MYKGIIEKVEDLTQKLSQQQPDCRSASSENSPLSSYAWDTGLSPINLASEAGTKTETLTHSYDAPKCFLQLKLE